MPPDEDRDTLPLIPIREETGLPPPPKSGVRRVLAPMEEVLRVWT